MTDEHHQFTSSPDQWEYLKPAARAMRHDPTHAEDALWRRLRGRRLGGTKFRRQHSIEGFVMDFVCIDHRIIIEVDGSVHDEPDQQAHDQARQVYLERLGFQMLRFTNDQVFLSIESVLNTIRLALNIEDDIV
jgi:very-short-patch-repair endonuclease